MGKNTRSAIGQYQEKAGLPITGNVDATTLAAMRKGESQTGEEVTKPDTVASTPSAKKNQLQDLHPNSPTDDPGKATTYGADQSNSDTLSAFSKKNWIRLSLIALLGFAALGTGGWFIATALGLGVAFLIHNYATVLWPFSIMIGLASLYALPLFAAIFWKSFSTAVALLLLFSLPVTLASHYFFDTQWLIALVDGVALVVLAPFGITRCLVFFGIIDEMRLSQPESSHVYTMQPNPHSYNASGTPDHFVRCDAPSQSSSSPIQSR